MYPEKDFPGLQHSLSCRRSASFHERSLSMQEKKRLVSRQPSRQAENLADRHCATESSGSIAYQRQESVAQKANPTRGEYQSDEEENLRSNPVVDLGSASCEHDTMIPTTKPVRLGVGDGDTRKSKVEVSGSLMRCHCPLVQWHCTLVCDGSAVMSFINRKMWDKLTLRG